MKRWLVLDPLRHRGSPSTVRESRVSDIDVIYLIRCIEIAVRAAFQEQSRKVQDSQSQLLVLSREGLWLRLLHVVGLAQAIENIVESVEDRDPVEEIPSGVNPLGSGLHVDDDICLGTFLQGRYQVSNGKGLS